MSKPSFVYTVEVHDGGKKPKKQTFEGFRGAYLTSETDPDILVVAQPNSTEVELWSIDPDNFEFGMEELQRFYRSEHGSDTVLMTIFDRRK